MKFKSLINSGHYLDNNTVKWQNMVRQKKLRKAGEKNSAAKKVARKK
jgi:hypothetical protein